MVRKLELRGFKSFVSDEVDFGKLTVLTGLNSSGKSSVIQALQLSEQAVNHENNAPFYLPGHGALHESRNPFYSVAMSIGCSFGNHHFVTFGETDVWLRSTGGGYIFPDIIHITADRFGPETSLLADPNSTKLGKKGENIFRVVEHYADWVLPAEMQHPNSEGETFLFNLRAWLQIVSPNVKFESFVEAKSDTSHSTFDGHRAKNVGFGLSYTLPVITALLLGSLLRENTIVILENPEAHLHPRGQTAMAELICRCAKAGTQVIIETHSDHLFDGIRLFAKEDTSGFHEDIQVYWFELDKNRNTEVTSAHIDTDGRMDEWPAGMFDQFGINAGKLL